MEVVNRKNASALRKYFIEYTVLFLTASVVTLFYMYNGLNSKIVELQTTVINENTKANVELKQELQNLQNKIK